MSTVHESGKQAEQRAVHWLTAQGYSIIGQNVHVGVDEIDILARKGTSVHCVEVKYRSSQRFGGGAAAVDARKRSRLIRSAQLLAAFLPPNTPIIIDVISVDRNGAVILYENITL